MTIDESIEYLKKQLPSFDRKVFRDIDKHGNEFCEMVMQNVSMPSLPITVHISDDGCSISVGQIENVTGSDKMTAAAAVSAICDITSDKIVFVLGYKDEDDIGFGKPFMTEIFALTGGDDDMSKEYERLIDKISSPLSKVSRFFSSLKGRFSIMNFSGSINKTITRL